MVKIKTFILGFDCFWLSVSGYSIVDIIGTFISGNLALSGIDNFIKLLFSMAGLIYLLVRIYNTIMMSKLERRYKEQEIIEKQNANHKNNTYQHFKESLTEINHENLKL